MVAVSSAEVLGLITVIRVIAPPRRVSGGKQSADPRRRRPRFVRPRAPARAAAYGSPLRRYSAANAPQNASPAPVLSTGSTTSVGTAVGSGLSRVATRQPASASLMTTVCGPCSRKACAASRRGRRCRPVRPLRSRWAGTHHTPGPRRAARPRCRRCSPPAGRRRWWRRCAVAARRPASSCACKAMADNRIPGAASAPSRDVGRVHGQRLEVRLPDDQVPDPRRRRRRSG